MKLFKSPIWGGIQEPESFDELMSILAIEESKDFVPVRYWRGQSDISWPIDSAGVRRIKKGRIFRNVEYMLSSYEQQLLQQATHKGYRHANGRELFDFELLGRLQHHGAATRLVDFSRNAFIALYFTVTNNIDKTGLLFGLHTSYVLGHENIVLSDSYPTIIEACQDCDSPSTWEPTIVSPRIAAQHSQFIYSITSDEKTGSLLLPKEEKAKLFIAITPRMKQKVKNILEGTLDFRTMTLFPDIDGFGMANNANINRWEMDRW